MASTIGLFLEGIVAVIQTMIFVALLVVYLGEVDFTDEERKMRVNEIRALQAGCVKYRERV